MLSKVSCLTAEEYPHCIQVIVFATSPVKGFRSCLGSLNCIGFPKDSTTGGFPTSGDVVGSFLTEGDANVRWRMDGFGGSMAWMSKRWDTRGSEGVSSFVMLLETSCKSSWAS
jgi:hypothetical protein